MRACQKSPSKNMLTHLAKHVNIFGEICQHVLRYHSTLPLHYEKSFGQINNISVAHFLVGTFSSCQGGTKLIKS